MDPSGDDALWEKAKKLRETWEAASVLELEARDAYVQLRGASREELRKVWRVAHNRLGEAREAAAEAGAKLCRLAENRAVLALTQANEAIPGWFRSLVRIRELAEASRAELNRARALKALTTQNQQAPNCDPGKREPFDASSFDTRPTSDREGMVTSRISGQLLADALQARRVSTSRMIEALDRTVALGELARSVRESVETALQEQEKLRKTIEEWVEPFLPWLNGMSKTLPSLELKVPDDLVSGDPL